MILQRNSFLSFLYRDFTIMTFYSFRERTYTLQHDAYNATTLWKNYIQLLNGTSSAIARACDPLRKLKARIVVGASILKC